MVYEDVHWSDPTTRESLDLLIDRVPSAAGAGDHHLPAGVHAALDRAPPCDDAHAQSPAATLGDLFDLEDLGAKDLKGIAGPVRAWAALRTSSVESRFEALRTATTPLVGRDEEIELLMRRWDAGESGRRLRRADLGRARYRQVAHRSDYAWSGLPASRTRGCAFSARRITRTAHSIRLSPSSNARRASGARTRPSSGSTSWRQCWHKATNDLSEVAPLLADLLSIPTGDRYPALNLTPQKRKEKTLHGLVAQVEGLAARQPVLMVFEDVHWSDPTTRESLDLLIDRVSDAAGAGDHHLPAGVHAALDRPSHM